MRGYGVPVMLVPFSVGWVFANWAAMSEGKKYSSGSSHTSGAVSVSDSTHVESRQ